MKSTTPLIFLLLCLFNVGNVFAQSDNVPRDTIYYHGNESLSMYILSADYHELSEDSRLLTIMQDFQSRLKEMKGDIPQNESYIIEYKFQTKIEILQSNKIVSYSLSANSGPTENFRNQAILTIPQSRNQVNIQFNDTEALMNADFKALLEGIVAELPEKNRHLRFLEYQYEGEIGKSKLIENKVSGDMDMLRLSAGIGANVYRSKFLTDISGELAFQFNKKGILKNQFYASTNLMFSFNEDNSPVINTFVNLGYKVNFSSQKDDPNWLGMEFGTIVNRNGDVFKPNTMRFGLNWAVGKGISVAPQLYFNGFFKEVTPGFRIGIGF